MLKTLKLLLKTLFFSCVFFLVASVALVLMLRWVNPPTSAVIIAWEFDNQRSAKQQWLALNDISPHLQIAVIASEDQKFPHHFGFDIESIQKALNENNNRPRGASTISQQLAKNLFLWNGRSYIRKAFEAYFTLLMELFWPKERILEMYVNIAEFGPGIYGAQAAAEKFFGVSAKKITPWQAGLLAAVLPSPKRMSAGNPSTYVQSRAIAINKMVEQLGGPYYLKSL